MKYTAIRASLKYLLLLQLLLTGCSTDLDRYTYTDYKRLENPNETKALTSQTIVSDNELYLVNDFLKMADFLVVIDSKGESLINVFDYRTGDRVAAFGDRGQGPNEFISAWELIRDPVDSEVFYVYDISTGIIKGYRLSKILDGIYNYESRITLDRSKGITRSLAFANNRKMVGCGFYTKGRICVFDRNGQLVRTVGVNPVKMRDEQFAPQHSHAFEGNIVVTKDSNDIYIATRTGSIVEKYQLQKGLIETFIGPDVFFPAYDIEAVQTSFVKVYTEDSRFGYVDSSYCKDRDELYLLYSGSYANEHDAAPAGSVVYVMNSKGSIARKLELDQKVWLIQLSDDCRNMLGLSVSSGIVQFTCRGN